MGALDIKRPSHPKGATGSGGPRIGDGLSEKGISQGYKEGRKMLGDAREVRPTGPPLMGVSAIP